MNPRSGEPHIGNFGPAFESHSAAQAGLIPVETVTVVPYPVARRLRAICVDATMHEITMLVPDKEDVQVISELQALTGRRVAPVETPLEEIEFQLDRLSGMLDNEDLWLQRRHIHSLGRLVDHSLNLGQVQTVRGLVDRALEFAPYSAELWLLKARASAQRQDVVQALTVAAQTAPNDRRILRWIGSIEDLNDEPVAPQRHPPVSQSETRQLLPRPQEQTPTRETPPVVAETDERNVSRPEEPAAERPRPAPTIDVDVVTVRSVVPGDARRISRSRSLPELMEITAEALMEVAEAASVTIFFREGASWAGFSTDAQLQSRIATIMPKENRLSSQALEQGLPVVVADVADRREDVGQVIYEAGIASFALLPILTSVEGGGLAYLNFRQPERATIVFDDQVGRSIDLLLNCAGAAAAGLERGPGHWAVAIDPLTSTYSFPQFERLMIAEVERAKRYRFSVAVMAVDVDNFAGLNAAMGRQAGDETLKQVAERIEALRRLSDIVTRKGDDEFLVMLPQTTARGGEVAAQRMQSAFAQPLTVGLGQVPITVSIGVAAYPEHAGEAADLLTAAEIALYGAKADGKNRTKLADILEVMGQ